MQKGLITIGIQGGPGSFNQAALEHILSSDDCPKEITGHSTDTRFLYQTSKVLEALDIGKVDWGLFAIWNSTTKIVVKESAEAMINYSFLLTENASKVLDDIEFPKGAFPSDLREGDPSSTFQVEVVFSIPIRHYLMRLPGVEPASIKTIMTHPQVLGQCRHHLDKLLPDLDRVSGVGDLMNTSAVAKALSGGELDPNTYVLGSKVLADIYGLTIDHEHPFEDEKVGWQDDEENRTYFVLARRA